MEAFSKIKFQSRGDLVVDKITNSIINGELADGEILPSENRLCEIFGVSRSILREGMRVLVAKGLVEVKQGHGSFVRLPQVHIPEEAIRNYLMTNPFSLQQLVEIRSPIETEVARLAAERREEKHLLPLRKTLQTMKNPKNGVDAYADADEAFHKSIIDASGNPLFGIMIRSIMGNLHLSRQLAIRHFGIEVVIREHEEVYEAIRDRQPANAVRKMKKHMENALERINQVNELLHRKA
jgi:DNA-binding FadR family transcriptional regulator